MRGCYTMGALEALDEIVGPTAFDLVVGTSSGAMNASYFLAGRTGRGRIIYRDYLTNGRFVNLKRFWKIVDIDYLSDIIRGRVGDHPLDVDGLRSARADLIIGLSEARTASPVFVSAQDLTDEELFEALRGTAALPGIYNRKVELRGERFVDGALIESLPVLRALAFGCSKVVVLSSRELDYRSTDEPSWHRYIGKVLTIGQSWAVRRVVATAAAQVKEQRSLGLDRDACIRHHAKMDEAPFFEAGDDFDVPSGGAFYPVGEFARIACVAHGAGRDHAHLAYAKFIACPAETLQHFHRRGDRPRGERSVAERPFTEARDLAVFMQRVQPTAAQLRDLEADGVRPDIDRSEVRHP